MSAARETAGARATTTPERRRRAGGEADGEPLRGPDVRVVRGAPAAEELAALLVVWARLTAAAERPAAGRAGGRGAAAPPPARPFEMTGVPAPGTGAWRRSAWTS
ncbi:acyl-CoA carboxylase subunit epsilon [Streptomyces sp. NPDC020917]|uniref:acyl-CoA carboxylase subunit epsilon n=1 Tax=Streptomyces sp. NPDC020917 TaxID=3365102 RepID=UPI00378B3E05